MPIVEGMENKQIGLTVFATSLAFLLVQLDVSIINVSLAAIGARWQVGVLGLQWVVDSYALAFASLLLSTGALGDRLGHRRVFILGLALFTGASAACGLAWSETARRRPRFSGCTPPPCRRQHWPRCSVVGSSVLPCPTYPAEQ